MVLVCALPMPVWARSAEVPPVAAPGRRSIALPEVSVSADRDRGHGPVRGYVAPVSATATKTDTPVLETPQSDYVSTCNTYAWCWYGFRRSVIATLRHSF